MKDLEKSKIIKDQAVKPEKWLGYRHIQFILLFLAAVTAYGMRTNLSVGVVAMLDENPPDPSIPTYPEWADYKNTMLSSFFWGYVCLQIVAGQLAKKYGPKWFLAGAITTTSLFSILMPIFAYKEGYQGVIICRVFQGLSQGFLYPSVHNLVTKWSPLAERSKIASFVYAGGPLGTVISMPVTGLISQSKLGWPAVFYGYGALGLAWVACWLYFGSNCPSEHRHISSAEKKYIEAGQNIEKGQTSKTPWLKIFTSLPISAIIIAHAGFNWCFWTLLTEIPSYMDQILKFNLSSNALIGGLPYLVLWILSFVFSPIADYLISRNITSTGTCRKIFNSIGLIVPAFALIGLCFVRNNSILAVTLLVFAVGMNAAVYSGFNVNHIDIAPNNSGTLMGLTNTISGFCSIIAPLAVDGIISMGYKETDEELWAIIFSISAAISAASALYFNLFASGELQSWDSTKPLHLHNGH